MPWRQETSEGEEIRSQAALSVQNFNLNDRDERNDFAILRYSPNCRLRLANSGWEAIFDVRKHTNEAHTDQLGGGDDHDANRACNQSVLNCGCTIFVTAEFFELLFHRFLHLSFFKTRSTCPRPREFGATLPQRALTRWLIFSRTDQFL